MYSLEKSKLEKEQNWQQELQQAYSDPIELLKDKGLSDLSLYLSQSARKQFAMRVPHHFASKIEYANPNDPILRQVLPNIGEEQSSVEYVPDPLQELKVSHDGLLHKYDSRVLWLIAGACAINCRYCFRRNFPYHDHLATKKQWQSAKTYIENQPEINEIILSGGDPLLVNDQYLGELFNFISSIKQITRIRIHSRIPTVLPARVTNELCDVFRRAPQKIVMVLHINHPNELCQDTQAANKKLKESCDALLNQSVLLYKVNDCAEILSNLSEKLFEQGVLPYYLHTLDKVKGASHFDSKPEKVKEIYLQLQKILPGFLVPKLAIEKPKHKNKTLLTF